MKLAIAKLGKVAVLMGGRSSEREVSLKSGQAVLKALQSQGVDAHGVDPAQQSLAILEGYDRAIIALHGRYGEDGSIQGALELMHIPYTGSGVMASALAMDKWRSKLMWQAHGISTPPFEMLKVNSQHADLVTKLGLPMFIKPVNEGSSIGISKVKNTAELAPAYALATQSGSLVIAEKYIDGGEYTVGILGTQALPIVRIVPKNEYYDYEAKYLRDDTEYLCPSGLTEEVETKIQAQALQAFEALGCKGWGRVDFLMDTQGQHYFLEVNTSPGMTDHSLVPMAAKAAGISFETLVLQVLMQTIDHDKDSV